MAASSSMKIASLTTAASTSCVAGSNLTFKFLVTLDTKINDKVESMPRSGISVKADVYGGTVVTDPICTDSCGVADVVVQPSCQASETSVQVTSGAVASDRIAITFDSATASLAPGSGDAIASPSVAPSASPIDIPSPIGGKSFKGPAFGR